MFNRTLIASSLLFLASCSEYRAASELKDMDLDPASPQHLVMSAESGDAAVITLFIAAGKIELDAQRPVDEKTALHGAAEAGNSAVLRLLIEAGANIEIRDKKKKTPLISAASNGDIQSLMTLTKAGANANAQDDQGKTTLHYLAMLLAGRANAISRLLDPNLAYSSTVQLNIPDNIGNTPLHTATVEGAKKAVELLLNHGVEPAPKNKAGETPFGMALEQKNEDIIDLLKNAGGAATCLACTKLLKDASTGNVNSVRNLLDYGIPVDIRDNEDNTVLGLAISRSDSHLIEELLGREPDLTLTNAVGHTYLHLGTLQKDYKIFYQFLESSRDKNKTDNYGYSAVATAVQYGMDQRVMLLLDQGASVTGKTENGFSLLHLAAGYSSEAVLQRIQKKFKNPDIKSPSGMTPLMFAVSKKKTRNIPVLLRAKATVEMKDDSGATALTYAIRGKQLNVVKYLLSRGAKINGDLTRDGLSPLHHAVLAGNRAIVTFMLDEGALPNTRNPGVKSVLETATAQGDTSMAVLLKNYGAR